MSKKTPQFQTGIRKLYKLLMFLYMNPDNLHCVPQKNAWSQRESGSQEVSKLTEEQF